MIGVDTSTLIAYIQGDGGEDVDRFDAALRFREASLPAVVVTEALSQPGLPTEHRERILGLPLLEILPEFWSRAGGMRAALQTRGLKARLADTLIAQSCLDHDVALITRDADFRHFAAHCGLRLG